MEQQSYTIDNVEEGGTFEGFIYELLETINNVDVPVDLTGCDVMMDMVDSQGSKVKSFKSSDSTLSILGNQIIIPPQIITLRGGRTYSSDISIKFADGSIENGAFPTNWMILKPITKR